jgi:hypothetical protein
MTISPLRAPIPRHPDQEEMFPGPITTTFATREHEMSMMLVIKLHRVPRQKCSACGNRRICYFIGLGEAVHGPIMCARCAGIR